MDVGIFAVFKWLMERMPVSILQWYQTKSSANCYLCILIFLDFPGSAYRTLLKFFQSYEKPFLCARRGTGNIYNPTLFLLHDPKTACLLNEYPILRNYFL